MDKNKNRKILIQILCIIASFVLWLYVANVENPTQTVKLRGVIVKLENTERITESKLAILPHDEYSVTLTIKGPSSEVNRIKADQFTLAADFGDYSLRKGENSIPVYVKQAPYGNVNVVETYLSIKVSLDELVEKSVPIKSTGLKITTMSGYTYFEPVFKPTSVIISGAAQYVNVVTYVEATSIFKDLEKDGVANLPLLARSSTGTTVNEVVLTPNAVDVVVPVRKTKIVPINVKTKGIINKDLSIKPIEITPDKIEIAGDVGLLNSINSLDIEPIDYATLTVSKNVDVKLAVPNNITIVNGIGTVSAKITIEKIITSAPQVTIKFNNLGADYNMVSDISKVLIDVRGIESKINSLNLPEDIKVFVDLINLVEGNEQVVNINVTVPEGVTFVNKTPASVKVNITRKIPAATPTPIPTPALSPAPTQ